MNIEATLKNLDSPIQTFEEDLLQRRGFVESLCRIFESASPDESTVFALYGDWGSGKTSVKNLLKKELAVRGSKAPLPVEFNPWAFSGQDQVLEAFFSEVGKVISSNPNGKKVAEGFKKLGAYLSFGAKTAKTIHIGMDLFGIPGSKLVGMCGEHLEGGSKSTKEYGEDINAVGTTSLELVQKELKASLNKLEHPLVIILDDLDRLTSDQLLLVFQIVKLNASLPRVNYLLLMDRKTAEARLADKRLGHEFIEKIVQFELNLPHAGEQDLKAILKEGFKAVLGPFANRIDWERWEDAWPNGCQNLFTTLRKIKRFLHTLQFHVRLFTNDDVIEVDPVDLFLVEVLRTFAPIAYEELPRTLSNVIYVRRRIQFPFFVKESELAEFGKLELIAVLKAAPEDIKTEIESLIRSMFPQIGRGPDLGDKMEWIRDTRICHELFFESYFRLAIPVNLLTQKEIKDLFAIMTTRELLKAKMTELYQKAGLRELLIRIRCHCSLLKPELVPNLLGDLWALDESDTRAAGVERNWDTRDAAQGMSRFLLKNYCVKEARVQTALIAMRSSDTIYPLARFVKSELQELEKNPHSGETAFDQDQLTELRKQIIQQIHGFAATSRLLDSPDSGVLMLMWEVLESKEVVRAWLKTQIEDSNRLPFILSRFVSKSTILGQRPTTVHYFISRQILEQCITLDEQFEKRLSAINSFKLPHWEKFAVEETLKRIDEKNRGIQEIEYPL